MIKGIFKRIGITLTEAQIKLVKCTLWFIVVLGLVSASIGASVSDTQCVTKIDSAFFISRTVSDCSNTISPENAAFSFVALSIVFAVGVLPILFYSIFYFGKLLFNKKFRDDEMSQSVNYLENDEREQFMTMKATKRSYMVLNFALMISWLLSLIFGNFSLAFWLIIIQAIGALSFRREIGRTEK